MAYPATDPMSVTVAVFRDMLDNAGGAKDWLEGKGVEEEEGRETRFQNERRAGLMKLLPHIFAPEAIPNG